MAIQRLTGTQIETAVLEATGYSASTLAPWLTSANFILRLNDVVQRLPQRATMLARQMGMIGPQQRLNWSMWKTVSAASGADTTTGVQTYGADPSRIYFPTDYSEFISLYDETADRDVPLVENASQLFVERLKDKLSGPPEAVEIQGFVADDSSNWRRRAYLYPVQTATPSVTLTYYRIPAAMADGTEYPDIDPKYESLLTTSCIVMLSAPAGPEYERHAQMEQQMLQDMVANATIV